MEQKDIFKQAIAAKLNGDEAAFKTAMQQAIKEKAKAILGEAGQNTFRTPMNHSRVERGQTPTEFYMFVDPEHLEQIGLPGIPDAALVINVNVSHSSAGRSASWNEPEEQAEIEFNIESAHISDGSGQAVQQITPQQATSLMNDDDFRAIDNYLHASAQSKDWDA